MKVRIVREISVDAEVTVGIEEIREAIADVTREVDERPDAFSVGQLVTSCWQTLCALSDEQIQTVGDRNRPHIAKALRDLADRFFPVSVPAG